MHTMRMAKYGAEEFHRLTTMSDGDRRAMPDVEKARIHRAYGIYARVIAKAVALVGRHPSLKTVTHPYGVRVTLWSDWAGTACQHIG